MKIIPNPVHEDELQQINTASDFAGDFQPLEDQRLSTTDDVTFNSVTLKNDNGDTVGRMFWDDVNRTISFDLLNGTTLNTGQEIYFAGKASGDIGNGELVQFAGIQGDHLLFKKVVPAEVISNPTFFVGVATQDILNGEFGYVTWLGQVNDIYTNTPDNQDNQGWNVADILYMSNTTGQLTSTEPAVGELKIEVAVVQKIQTGTSQTGRILVRPTIFSRLKDLSDVNGADPTVTGQALTWNQTLGVWERDAYNFEDYQKRLLVTETSTTTATMSDDANIHICNGSSDYVLTLPTHEDNKQIRVLNINTGIVTLNATSGTIYGSSSEVVNEREELVLLSYDNNWI